MPAVKSRLVPAWWLPWCGLGPWRTFFTFDKKLGFVAIVEWTVTGVFQIYRLHFLHLLKIYLQYSILSTIQFMYV